MFIVNFVRKTIFSLRGIYDLKDEKTWKFIVYFLLLSLVSLFPHNYQIIKSKGFKMGFITELSQSEKNQLKNTKIDKIGFAGIRDSNDDFTLEIYNFDKYIMVIDLNNEYDINSNTENKAVLILYKETLKYYDEERNFMTGNYNSFDRDIRTSELTFNNEVFDELLTGLEKSFYSYIIFYSIINNIVVQTSMYFVMILLMAVILSFLKYGFSKKVGYLEICKILVLSMTLPSIIVFVIGWFDKAFAFTPIIMNFMIGGIGLLVMKKVAKNRVELETGK